MREQVNTAEMRRSMRWLYCFGMALLASMRPKVLRGAINCGSPAQHRIALAALADVSNWLGLELLAAREAAATG
jgi:hypothetical protein